MAEEKHQVTIAAIQAAPVFLDREATVEKACHLIEDASKKGANIIGFSESFIPTFPHWVNVISPNKPRLGKLYVQLFENAVEIPSPTTDLLCETARQEECYVVMGINEKKPGTKATLYNSLLFMDPAGSVLGVHRKLMPTFGERLVHALSDGQSLQVHATEYGGLGGLICGEHNNPLAKFTLFARGENIHAAAWPAYMCNFGGHFILQQYAYEGKVFILSASDVITPEVQEALGDTSEPFQLGGGSSGIYEPDGHILAQGKPDREEILVAKVDLSEITRLKMINDTVGHYNRFDIFQLTVKDAIQQSLHSAKE